jgi:small conductance mechanosensitive channel
MDTPDNRRFILPNNSITGGTIENISHHSVRRADVSVGTDYSADLDRTRQVLEQAASGVANRLADRDPQIVLTELGGSSIDWQVRVWVEAEHFWGVKEATTRAVKIALDEAGIGIPFPQMDVHLDKPA